jgi:hypothetical protein
LAEYAIAIPPYELQRPYVSPASFAAMARSISDAIKIWKKSPERSPVSPHETPEVRS